MNRRIRRTAARCLRAGAPLCLLLAACTPTDDPSAVEASRFRVPLPEARRTANPDPENARWLAAWRDLRSRLNPLEEKLAGAQNTLSENQLDSFLQLDPESLEKDDLCSLFHFLERDYFTVERRILIHLLERRFQRSGSMVAIPPKTKTRFRDRLSVAMQRDELRMVDLEAALEYYREPGADNFQIPDSLTDEEMSELRTAVSDMLEKTRDTIAEMDGKIDDLKSQVFGTAAVPAEKTPEESKSLP